MHNRIMKYPSNDVLEWMVEDCDKKIAACRASKQPFDDLVSWHLIYHPPKYLSTSILCVRCPYFLNMCFPPSRPVFTSLFC